MINNQMKILYFHRLLYLPYCLTPKDYQFLVQRFGTADENKAESQGRPKAPN